MTNVTLPHRRLTPNITLRKAINAFKDNLPNLKITKQTQADLDYAISLKV